MLLAHLASCLGQKGAWKIVSVSTKSNAQGLKIDKRPHLVAISRAKWEWPAGPQKAVERDIFLEGEKLKTFLVIFAQYYALEVSKKTD